jgi:hypothetical protein
MSSLSLIATVGQTIDTSKLFSNRATGQISVAFGGGYTSGNGKFIVWDWPTSVPLTCDIKTFGGVPSGATQLSGCYQVLAGYHYVANEHAMMTVGNMAPIAMGANGNFLYTRKSGSFYCDWSQLFGKDPAPGILKECYVLDNASSASPTPEGGYFGTSLGVSYTSGYWGNVIYTPYTGPYAAHYCSNATFGGDPEVGQTKYCYAVPQPIIY